MMKFSFFSFITLLFLACGNDKGRSVIPRMVFGFNDNWRFQLGDTTGVEKRSFDDSKWRQLNLPHDWSIEGEFSPYHLATVGGGALPGGIGWYRKTFALCDTDSVKRYALRFDGVYMNSEVWINGVFLGKRPNGYISFEFDLSPYLYFGSKENILAVKVSNDPQPNSRWYSGSGIYRNVWLTKTARIFVNQHVTHITTPSISQKKAVAAVSTEVHNSTMHPVNLICEMTILNPEGKKVNSEEIELILEPNQSQPISAKFNISGPQLWSVKNPDLYTMVIKIFDKDKLVDKTENTFGIRYFDFDPKKGFSLNGETMKIRGVCNHHDLGCLGTAINTRALERQLEIMRDMGVNAIRTSHNPPAPELLDLCDKMGFLVMDEMFDMWTKAKSPFDYHLYWDEWHARDLRDFIMRDRNHPSVIIWSVGNEIPEQWDESGAEIVKELVAIVQELDTTRAITVGCNPPKPDNKIVSAGVLDLVGFNYDLANYEAFPEVFPGKCFIATETTSALATRGHYEYPSDTIFRWPFRWDIPFARENGEHTISAYDQVSTPWGSTHEEAWKIIKKHDYLSGMFIWTGFDYLGEPTPFGWPSRSSYFGIVDLAGFPKDSYYMYKSEWTTDTVLHIFPHWNWNAGDTVDVWCYTNVDEVELTLNGASLGKKSKSDDDLHLMWRVPYKAGLLQAKGTKGGVLVVEKNIKTAGHASAIQIEADRTSISADGDDLSFITVSIRDTEGNIYPYADNLVHFEIDGPGKIVGVDNGNPVSHESFKENSRMAFHGLCLVVVQSTHERGIITLSARSEGLKGAKVELQTGTPNHSY